MAEMRSVSITLTSLTDKIHKMDVQSHDKNTYCAMNNSSH